MLRGVIQKQKKKEKKLCESDDDIYFINRKSEMNSYRSTSTEKAKK